MTGSDMRLREHLLQEALSSTGHQWQQVCVLQDASSTNELARDLAGSRQLDGDQWGLVLADTQQAGRGRRGATWFSPAGSAIHLSLVTRLGLPDAMWPRASLVVGSAVIDAVQELCGISVHLKWPNDLLLLHDGAWRKLGGVLCERHEPSPGRAYWIAGVGLNFNTALEAFPETLQDSAVSLSWRTEALPSRELLAAAIAQSVRDGVERWQRADAALEIERFERQMAFIGDEVALDMGGLEPRWRTLVGLDHSGGVRVQATDGGLVEVLQPLQITAANSSPPWHAPPRSDN